METTANKARAFISLILLMSTLTLGGMTMTFDTWITGSTNRTQINIGLFKVCVYGHVNRTGKECSDVKGFFQEYPGKTTIYDGYHCA